MVSVNDQDAIEPTPNPNDPIEAVRAKAEQIGSQRGHFMAEIPKGIIQSADDPVARMLQCSNLPAEVIASAATIHAEGLLAPQYRPRNASPARAMLHSPDRASRVVAAMGLLGHSIDGWMVKKQADVSMVTQNNAMLAVRRRLRREAHYEAGNDLDEEESGGGAY